MRNATIVAPCLPAALLFGLPALLAASCASTPVVDVVLEDPENLRENAAFAQLVVFDDGCPDKTDLAEGRVDGHRWMQSIDADGSFNEIGSLDKAPYGFAALLRDDNCGVMGFGCTPVDLEHHRHVTIAVNEIVSPPRGACEPDETCSNSQCIPAGPPDGGVDVEDAKPDTGPLTCELEIIAANNFDEPAAANTLYGGAVVTPTPTGFVVMYHEADPAGESPRLVRVKITDDGEETHRTNVNLTPCADTIESSGIGAAWNDNLGAGMMAASRPACTAEDDPTMHISNFDRDGKTIAEIAYGLPSPILLDTVNSVAASPTDQKFLLAAMTGPAPFLYAFDGVTVQEDPPPSEIHQGSGTVTFAQVATGPSARATLTDSDLESGKLIVTVNDLASGASSTTSFPRTTVTSLAVWQDRAAVIQPSSTSLAWNVFTKSGTMVNDGTLSGGPYTAMDIAQLHDYLLIAAGKPSAITVFRLDDANGTISGASTFQANLTSSFDNAQLDQYQGNRVAIAAARGRVVVTWTTSDSPLSSASTAPGGYAVLGCDG